MTELNKVIIVNEGLGELKRTSDIAIRMLEKRVEKLQAENAKLKAQLTDQTLEKFQEIIRNQCDEISALKAQLTWRPVSEKPEREGRYWCLLDTSDEIKTGEYSFEEGCWWEYDGGHYPYYMAEWHEINELQVRITHWLPIPPMKEGE